MKMKEPLCRTQVQNRQKRFKIFSGAVSLFCGEILDLLNQPERILSVVFVSLSKMQEVNKNFRGKDSPTDVLSFCYRSEMVDGLPFLGEIVISPEVAYKNALACRRPFEAEIRRLLLHGILHLLGYDHETDSGEMRRLQSNLQRRRIYVSSASVVGTTRKQ
jgi:probable rRNA maturation factor